MFSTMLAPMWTCICFACTARNALVYPTETTNSILTIQLGFAMMAFLDTIYVRNEIFGLAAVL